MKHCLSVLFAVMLFVCFSNNTYSQVEVVADGRLQTILEEHITYNQMSKTFIGYRIKVATFTGEGAKSKAFNLKDQLMKAYPNERCYVFFDEPNFNVKIGDYVSRLDAYSTYMKIKPQISTALIVKDYINSPIISEDDLKAPEYFEEELENEQ
jgi:hypothetical protein